MEGDIIGLDFGVILDGYYGDAALTVGVGQVSETATHLMEMTKKSLWEGIEQVRAGNRLGDLSHAIQRSAEASASQSFASLSATGSGVVCMRNRRYPIMGNPEGAICCARAWSWRSNRCSTWGEPGVTMKEDGWTAVTRDGSLSAHFEHSVAVTASGARVLTEV